MHRIMKTSHLVSASASASAALAVATLLTGTALAESPDKFVKEAIRGDNSEVMLGNLAAEQASSQDVKDFGRTLATDHGKAKDEAVSVAQQLNVAPPDGMKDEAKEEMAKLTEMSGNAFDDEFVAYMVKDHEKDISDFEEQADFDNGPAGDMAEKQLPTLKKHLQIAQSLQSKM